MKKKRKIKWGNIIATIIITFFTITLVISSKNIIVWLIDNSRSKELIDEINSNVVVVTASETDVEIIKSEEVKKSDPYWDYIKMDLINVEFDKLKNINNHTRGWIQVNGTNVNYPFVQADDNEYYLTHTFNKSFNMSGWLFLDYRNTIDNMQKNNIIYGHSLKNKSLFGSLTGIIKDDWLNNKDNYVVKLSTVKYNTLWQVFSVYNIPTTSDYLRVTFNSDNDFLDFSDMLIKRSIHDFNTNVTKDDTILTLSTCYLKTQKVVLHAKLIKKEAR